MAKQRVVDPYYAKRAAAKGIAIPAEAADPVAEAARAKLMEALQVQKAAAGANAAIDAAANNALLRGAGQPDSAYDTYRKARYGGGQIAGGGASEVDPMARFRAAPIMVQPDSYDPRGLTPSVETPSGTRTAVATGDPFMDVNTDFAQLERDRTLKNQNDAVFGEQNRRRLAAIAEARTAEESLRRQNLASQGLSEDEINRRMFPGRYATPVSEEEKYAKSVDLQQRNGRVALDGIASKFMRRGLSPAAAYAAAMNTMPTTSPTNAGYTPSLPQMDPMRIAATMGVGPGMAAGQYGVGMENAGNNLIARGQESRDKLAGTQAQADAARDVGLAGAGAKSLEAIMNFVLGALKQKQGDRVIDNEIGSAGRDQALQYLQSDAGRAAANSPDPRQRELHQKMMGAAFGASAQGGASAPLSSAFSGSSNPAFAQVDPRQLVGNPAAMQQWLAALPPEERDMRKAQAMVEAGMGNDPFVGQYLKQRFAQENPNLFSYYPDAWASSMTDAGTPSVFHALSGMLGLSNGMSRVDAAAQHAGRHYGIPADVAREHYLPWFNQ